MIPGRLSVSFWHEFTPVPCCGFVFVYMIQAQNLIPEQVKPVQVHPGNCTGVRFSFRYEYSFRCHVNAVRPFAPAWNHSPGSLERVAHAQSSKSNSIWRHNHVCRHDVSLHVNTVWNHKVIPVSNSHRCDFLPSVSKSSITTVYFLSVSLVAAIFSTMYTCALLASFQAPSKRTDHRQL